MAVFALCAPSCVAFVISSSTALPAWHHHDNANWHRLQAIDRSMLGAPVLYLAGSEGCPQAGGGDWFDLRADDWLGSGTLRNSFYVDPWAKLSHARELALVVDVRGSLRLRVMRATRGQAPLVLREMHIDAPVRGRHVLPLGSISALPEGSRLFWHVDAIDGARLHEAAWCTRSKPRAGMRLAVLMRTWGRTRDLQAQLERFAQGARSDPFHAELLARTDFWVLDTSADAAQLWPEADALALNLRVMIGPNLGGGGNASHLIHHFLAHCDAAPDEAPDEVLILDDDLLLSMESLARHWMLSAYRAVEHVASLPVLMKSRPTRMWEDGGFWGRLNFQEQGGFGLKRNFFPHLLKHGLSLDGFEHLDEFGPLNHCEYTTFIFFALPLTTLRRIGLPAAFFLRGDDIEYSLRAQAAGVPVITNPNLAAWHEPGHSYAQEYMAILHAVVINFSHSDSGAAEFARWFEQRLAEHTAIDDLDGARLYQKVLDHLQDEHSALLTPDFDAHYRAALPAFQAARMSPLPESERQRLERDAGEHGVLLRPFLYPGYQADASRHRAVVLVNAGAGTYRDLPKVAPAERLGLMRRYLATLAAFVEHFDALRARWRERLSASGSVAFWAEVAARHAGETQALAHGHFRFPPPPAAATTGEAGPPPPDADWPADLPVRELRLRIERELVQLARLRQGTAAQAGRAPLHGGKAAPLPLLARWWHALRRPSRRAPGYARRISVDQPLPADFDPAQYLTLNADVARTGIDAAQHYAQFGRAEGRRYRL